MIRNYFILLEVYKEECEYHCWMSKKKTSHVSCIILTNLGPESYKLL